LIFLILAGHGIFKILDKTLETENIEYSSIFSDQVEKFDKVTLQKIVRKLPLGNGSDSNFEISTAGNLYQITSSIEPVLQKYIIDHIDKKNSKQFGFIAIDPVSGRILSMVSYDRDNQEANTCLVSDFPAASLFKIITAAAAIEKCGFNSNTPLTFNGNKYTLYKNQLRERVNKHSNKVTFEKSFADSINPVFGKLGKNRLGRTTLEHYANTFGFNQAFNFEIPLQHSTMIIGEDPYCWAEIACGFNKKTMISPLHSALVVSSIVNKGKLIEPTVIDTISKDNIVLYRRTSQDLPSIIEPQTAETLKKMMNRTISSGTASKSFRGFKKDKILSGLKIGGKTGSINNNSQRIKYDWFTGFAEEKNGSKKIVICVIVVHQDYIGIRAARYSRLAIKEFFHNYYANAKLEKTKKSAAM